MKEKQEKLLNLFKCNLNLNVNLNEMEGVTFVIWERWEAEYYNFILFANFVAMLIITTLTQ